MNAGGGEMKRISLYGFYIMIIFLVAGPASCLKEKKKPGTITFAEKALYPEGIAWDKSRGKFMVSSLTRGDVGLVNDGGMYSDFIKDKRLISSTGVVIDAERERIIVCNADTGFSPRSSNATRQKLAALGIYKLSDGSPLSYIHLSRWIKGRHFANDLAVDDEGNIYVTDSFAPIIYKVDLQGNPWVFLEHERFRGKGFNLNGIVYHRDGYLLVAKYNEGIIFKVPLKNPGAFSQVVFPDPIHGVDGLLWAGDGSLVAIANEAKKKTNRIFRMTSRDNWESAAITAEYNTGRVFATTGTLRNGEVYFLHAKLHRLFNSRDMKMKRFSISRAVFSPDEGQAAK